MVHFLLQVHSATLLLFVFILFLQLQLLFHSTVPSSRPSFILPVSPLNQVSAFIHFHLISSPSLPLFFHFPSLFFQSIYPHQTRVTEVRELKVTMMMGKMMMYMGGKRTYRKMIQNALIRTNHVSQHHINVHHIAKRNMVTFYVL